MKTASGGLFTRLDMAKERISEFEHVSVENSQSEK